MKVNQIYQIVNTITQEILGATDLTVAEDLTNIVDIGNALFDATSVDNYVRKLVDHIGKVVFVNRPYSGRAPSVLMDGWEFGAVLEKIDAGVPDAEANPHWALENGQEYKQDIYTAPTDITVTFWKDKVTFQVKISVSEDLVKGSFSDATQLNAFFSMIYTKIDTKFTISLDGLIMATINNFSAVTYLDGAPLRSINILQNYKTMNPNSTVTAANCLYDLDFLKYASKQISLFSKRMTNASTLFNHGGRVRHTPTELQKIVMLDDFVQSAAMYLQADTFHDNFVSLPNADQVSYWQGSGKSYAFDDISSINVQVKYNGESRTVQMSGIICVIFDREALGVANMNRRVTAHYNAPGEFINNWYKMDAQYFNDFNENFILFYVADVQTDSEETVETLAAKK